MTTRRTLSNPISPSRLALYSYVLFLVAWLFPPDLYTSIIEEPDLMFLNPELFVFFTTCTLAFVGGVYAVRWFIRRGTDQQVLSMSSSVRVLCAPIYVTTLWALAYLADVGSHINLASILFAQQGVLIKNSESLSIERLAVSVPCLIGSLWWAYSRFRDQTGFVKAQRVLFWVTFGIGCFMTILVCVATVDRTRIMPFIFGTMILVIHQRYKEGILNRKKLLLIGLGIFGGVIALFAFFSFLRGFNSLPLILWTIMGYSIATYNRLAIVISGVLPSAFPGKPIHLFYYIIQDMQIEKYTQFRQAINWPDAYQAWTVEFPMVYSRGLNGAFIWLGFFGYIFTDIGWFTPLYIAGVGFITGWSWLWFRQRRALGLILYPWFAFSIIFWIGWAIVFNEDFVFLVITGGLLLAYEQLFFSERKITELPL